jgi:hypothetical protein
MLQALKSEPISAKRSFPHLPASVLYDVQRSVPAINFIDITDVTGRHETEPGLFAFYDRALESLVQTTYYGTGGEPLWAGTMQNLFSASGAYIVVQNPPLIDPATGSGVAAPLDIGRQLAFVRHYLSLNTTDLSRILLVERPTVYAWLDGKWDPKQENKGRIRKLYQVARTWHEMSKQPLGKLLREPIEGDVNLMDYLVRETLEMAAINRALELMREQSERMAKSKRVRSVREVAKQRGFKPLSSAQEDERFDQITKF